MGGDEESVRVKDIVVGTSTYLQVHASTQSHCNTIISVLGSL